MRYLVLLPLFFIASCAVFQHSGTSKTNKETKTLAGTSWTLDILVGADKEVTQKPVTITFDKDGRVYGSGGCNSYSGQYSVNGDSIKFGAVISTKMACMNGLKTESAFFEVLNTTNDYLVTKETLLLKEDGKVLASFNKFEKDK